MSLGWYSEPTTNLAISSLVAHAHLNPETQREFQLSLMRVLNNAPASINLHQKQLALIIALKELRKGFPADHQVMNSLAVMATIILGPRLLSAVSAKAADNDPESMH